MLALILILFEGGLELRLKDAIRYSPGGILLAFVSYAFILGPVNRRPIPAHELDRWRVSGGRAGLNQRGGSSTSN
jgi:hypothetical protein